jgi:hypothetical protein
MTRQIRVRELIGWDLDQYPFRPLVDIAKQDSARRLVSQKDPYTAKDAFCDHEAELLRDTLNLQLTRPELNAEMCGLEWSLGVVDFRLLLAFQRRLSFDPALSAPPLPGHNDWEGILELCFAPPKPIVCEVSHDAVDRTVTLQSSNPNLHLRVTNDPAAPLAVHAGGTFVEVALYKERPFLRDGYHRAYQLLKGGVFRVPAVIVRARTLQELGANQPWFFPEPVLLSTHPPTVCDFLNEALTVTYTRPPIIKTLRITMEEIISPAPFTRGEQA